MYAFQCVKRKIHLMTGLKNRMTFNFFSAIFSLVIISVFIRQRFPSGVGNMHYIWNCTVVLHLNRNLPAQENEHMTDVCCFFACLFVFFFFSCKACVHIFIISTHIKPSPEIWHSFFPKTTPCVWKTKPNNPPPPKKKQQQKTDLFYTRNGLWCKSGFYITRKLVLEKTETRS